MTAHAGEPETKTPTAPPEMGITVTTSGVANEIEFLILV